MTDLATITARAKRRGFVYPGSDIYGGLANAWDYGPYGAQLKKNIADIRRKSFVTTRPDMIGLDAQILMHPRVREASGHVANFHDPLIDDKKTHTRYRADKLIEASLEAQRDGSMTNADILAPLTERYGVANLVPESWTFEQMRDYIIDHIPNNPDTNKPADWTDVRTFQMMFYTYQGVVHDDENKIRLRPETAQGIFVNFKQVLDTTRMRLPFGIGQIGKAFRNEITPGQLIFRTREFEQMEIEYFVPPDEEAALKTLQKRQDDLHTRWTSVIGIHSDNLRCRDHEQDELSHYSKKTVDIEYKFPRGRGELQGLAYRTDFDLRNHQEQSKQDMRYTDPYTGERYVPHVIEPSGGLTRAVMVVMMDAYREETYTDAKGEEQSRVVVGFMPGLAPVQCAIFPLIKKDDHQQQIGRTLYATLSDTYRVEYDDNGAIGKRYRRQDEIGTPICITIDQQTCEDNTVTLRDRDTMQQQRVAINDIKQKIAELYSI